ncbi:YgaP family membrane protein [Methylobacterium nodulans]|uniref:DUF2892 domain-containing protein n=1 Tax=Methylobacterium nodulans (strain LMG 21967 / CNCM I-2342 / ORS 2060) TaxID=460265 RepID=B8IB79_METNO|nr:DUF2892 domain-containing protein [Methylobacterium nodulans]ACL57294.1 conserved hypothetical protein [Methylobacterium nodulans ORS 2060]
MIPGTSKRIPLHTSRRVTRRIEAELNESVRWHAAHPETIGRRLRQLDEEWDIERMLEANAATLALAGTVLGATRDRRWLVLPAAVTAFLLQHAIQGWCPPLPLLRRLGFRTAREIDVERNALKALRGDFGPIGPGAGDHDTRVSHALMAARL